MKRKPIDVALEREAQLADRRAQLVTRKRSGAPLDKESIQEMDSIRAELAITRARISRLLQNGARPSFEAPEVVDFPLAATLPES